MNFISIILVKIKQKGFLWLCRRLKRELRSPSMSYSQIPINLFLRARKKLFQPLSQVEKDDLIYGIYDLDVNPITFNFSEFLIDIEYEASLFGKKGFVVVIVPPSQNPDLIWKEYDAVIDSDSKLWRYHNIILPLTFLAPKCKGTFMLPRRSDVIAFSKSHEVYPYLYDGINLRGMNIGEFYRKLDRPGLFEGLRASIQGLNYIKAWLVERKLLAPIVTITIRSSAFDVPRNSNTEAWSSFAHFLESAGYQPVIIPDTDDAFRDRPEFEDLCQFKECAWNIGLRMALYETAYLNFFVPNGCFGLAIFNTQCSYICLNLLPAGSIVTTEESYKKIGHAIGTNYKFANERQRLCFQPDDYENIVREFELFVSEYPVNERASQNFGGVA
jgi:hypothetical protein